MRSMPVDQTAQRDPARHLRGLTPPQVAAAQHVDGPMLVVAGPGSGKTRTLTARLSYLVDAGAARPDELLAVTFTRKAAAEVRARLEAQLGAAARAVTVGTFHAVASLLCPTDGVPVLSEGDRLALLRRAAQATGARVRALQEALTHAKARGPIGAEDPGGPALAPELAAGLAEYERLRRALGAVDLDDLLLRAVQALQDGTAQRRFRLVSIDEYQDTNGVQRAMARGLGGEDRNVFAIGDPDQAIYGFRGADVRNFLAFADDFPGVQVVNLGDNFRSTACIVGAAHAVIRHNRQRAAVATEAAPSACRGPGLKLVRLEAPTEAAEAERLALEIDRLVGGTSLLSHDSGRSAAWQAPLCSFADVAILTRTAARADALAEALERAGVPLQRPRRAVLERDDAQDLCAYLRFVRAEGEPGEPGPGALFRILLREGPAVLPAVAAAAGGEGAGGAGLLAALRGADPTLHGRLLELRAELRGLDAAAQVARLAERLGTPAEVCTTLTRRLVANPLGLLDDGAAHESDEIDQRAERVSVLTLHGSKGLEFPVVFLAGCEAHLLPGVGTNCVEEERRLFYVGLTRARDALYLSHVTREAVRPGGPPRAPSPFLDEIPEELVHRPTPAARPARGQTKKSQLKLL